MNQETTEQYINKDFGQFRFQNTNRILVMDSFRAHISEKTKELCRKRAITLCIIPGGCTSILQVTI